MGIMMNENLRKIIKVQNRIMLNPELMTDILISAKIIDKNGKLKRPYRNNKNVST